MLARLKTKEFMVVALMALMLVGLAATLWADEAPAPPPTGGAVAAAPAAPAPPKPDPSGAATGTIADVPAKEAGKPTLLEVAEAVGHNRISINIMWTLITGFLVMFIDRKSTRLNSSHIQKSRMPSSA